MFSKEPLWDDDELNDLNEYEWPYDEDEEWNEAELINGWDNIEEIGDYRYVDEREDF
jgi:hypothetical protein